MVDIETSATSKERKLTAVSPTESYKNALRYSPPSGSLAGISDVEEKMMEVFKQMENVETPHDSTMPEMANLFELLPKVIEQ